MVRDIQQVMERWGAWAANNHEDVSWASIAAGFKGLIPPKVKSRPQCSDDDAMIICGCMARLNKKNQDLHDLLVDYYVGGMTFMGLARKHGCSDTVAELQALRQARLDLLTGKRVVSVQKDGRRIEYTAASLDELNRAINDAESVLGTTRRRRRPLGVRL